VSRPISSNSKKNKKRREAYGREQVLDKLAAFEEFTQDILPKLREMMKAGADSESMRAQVAPYLTAKALTLALKEQDSARALALIKDQLDRVEGKAKERVENTHKFQNMPEQDLDALLLSKLKGSESLLEDESEDGSH